MLEGAPDQSIGAAASRTASRQSILATMLFRTVTVAEHGLSAQAWAGPTVPSRERFQPPHRSENPIAKPPAGFYTSSLDTAESSTAWTRLHRTLEMARDPKSEGRDLWRLLPALSARLVVIDSLRDYQVLAEKFPKRWRHRHDDLLTDPDWAVLGELADGVHVTARAVDEARHGLDHPAMQIRAWQVESTLWYSWPFTDLTSLGVLQADGSLG